MTEILQPSLGPSAPGYQWAYAEAILPVSVTSGSLTPVTVISTNSFTLDKARDVWVEIFASNVTPGSGAGESVNSLIKVDGTDMGQIASIVTQNATANPGVPYIGRRKLSLGAGAHTIIWTAFRITNTGTILAGNGTGTNSVPAYIRVTTA